MARFKKKAADLLLVCMCMWGNLWAAPTVLAQPSDSVLLLHETKRPRASLLAALQAQLAGRVQLSVQRVAHADSVGQRIATASELSREHGALAVIWAEQPLRLSDGSREAVLYVTGAKKGRAMLDVVRVEGERGPDLDRALALKAEEIISELLRARALNASQLLREPQPTAAHTEAAPKAAPGQRASRPAFVRRSAPPSPRWAAWLRAGVALASQPQIAIGRFGLQLSAGPLLRAREYALGASAGLDWLPGVEAQRAGSLVQLSELVPRLSVEGQLRLGRTWLGLFAGGALELLAATGQTATGREASAQIALASGLLGARLELAISGPLGVGLQLSLLARPRRQQFAVNGQNVADVGRVRAVAGIHVSYRSGRTW